MASRRQRKGQHIRLKGIRRQQPDVPKLARAIIELARAQAEVDAEVAEQRRRNRQARTPSDDEPPSGARP